MTMPNEIHHFLISTGDGTVGAHGDEVTVDPDGIRVFMNGELVLFVRRECALWVLDLTLDEMGKNHTSAWVPSGS